MTTRPKTLALLAISSLAVLVLSAWPVSCAAPPPPRQPRGQPVLKPVTKDPATLLYTFPIRDGADLVIDTAGPLLWSTCADDHLPASFKCKDATCKLANAYHAPTCRKVIRRCKKQCLAYPYNPVTGRCAAAWLAHTRIVVNTTDGRNPLSQASIRAVKACAPRKLLASLPAHADGVAGLAGSGLALPAQIAASHNVANKFMLCLPRGGGEGVAIFGGGPFFLPQTPQTDVTSTLAFTPLYSGKDDPMHYISVKGIAMDHAQVQLPKYALANGGNAVICTRVPYTLLRPDVYRPVVDAFARALAMNDAKVPGVAGFELCYRSDMLGNTRLGYAVPSVVLMLDGGRNWTMDGTNSMVDVKEKTACLALVEMEGVKAGDANAPAVLIGGFQMENNLVQFDLEKKQLGFAKLPFFTSCSNFNFTRNQYYSPRSLLDVLPWFTKTRD